jgi:hypothetical protein
MDDGTIGGPEATVVEDFKMIVEEARNIGLEVNKQKCEYFSTSGAESNDTSLRGRDTSTGVNCSC